jgi:hypothetical protein
MSKISHENWTWEKCTKILRKVILKKYFTFYVWLMTDIAAFITKFLLGDWCPPKGYFYFFLIILLKHVTCGFFVTVTILPFHPISRKVKIFKIQVIIYILCLINDLFCSIYHEISTAWQMQYRLFSIFWPIFVHLHGLLVLFAICKLLSMITSQNFLLNTFSKFS